MSSVRVKNRTLQNRYSSVPTKLPQWLLVFVLLVLALQQLNKCEVITKNRPIGTVEIRPVFHSQVESHSSGEPHFTTTRDLTEMIEVGPIPSNWREEVKSVEIAPIFTCYDFGTKIQQHNKIAFVHIYKTAGSTMRGFFDKYSKTCRAGWQLVIQCTGVNATTLEGENSKWMVPSERRPGSGTLCQPKPRKFRSRNQTVIPRTFLTNDIIRQEVDILGGHMELGVADYAWQSYQNVQYVAFFREAVTMYISGKIFEKKGSLEEFVKMIRDHVNHDLSRGKYRDKYADYLITPHQRSRLNEMTPLDYQKTANLIKQNLLKYRVICGITERLPQSMEILHHLMDPMQKARSVFHEFGMPYLNGTLPDDMRRKNVKTGVTTSDVLHELEKDSEFMANLTEYVKYEQQVTDFAVQIHEIQYVGIKKTSNIMM